MLSRTKSSGFRLLCVVGCALFTACTSSTSPTEHLHLELAVDRTEIAVGSPMAISIRLSNALVTGARTAILHGSSSCTFGYQIRDAPRRLVAPTQRACTRDLREWYLEPGQQIERTLRWSGTLGEGSSEGVSPGSYFVVGVLESQEVRLESEPVAVQVRPAP